MHEYDAVVVGARCAGSSTAMLMARAGMRVLLLDRVHPTRDTLSTHALMRAGVLQLDRWGLLDRITAAGTPAVTGTTFHYADGAEHVALTAPLYAPRRTVLDPILVAAARDAGADVRSSTAVTAIERDPTGRVATVVTADGGRHSGRWVVGADGTGSVVAASVGAPIERQGTGATAVVYGYWPGLELAEYRWVFRPDACAGAIPTNDGETCIFVAASPSRIGRGGLDVLRAVLGEASPELAARIAGTAPARGVRRHGGRPGYLRRPWGSGWALVGDAGYWKDPISAHGLTDALRDAELLAVAIIDAASGRTDEPTAFGAYHATRDRVSLALFTVTDAIAAMRWTDEEIPGLLLQLNAAMNDEVDLITGLDAPGQLIGWAG